MTVAIRFERYPYSSSRTWEKKTHSINIHKQAFTPDVQIWNLPPKDWLTGGQGRSWDLCDLRLQTPWARIWEQNHEWTTREGPPAPHEVRWNAPWPVLPEQHRHWATTPAGQAQGVKSSFKAIWRAFHQKKGMGWLKDWWCCSGRNSEDFTLDVSSCLICPSEMDIIGKLV